MVAPGLVVGAIPIAQAVALTGAGVLTKAVIQRQTAGVVRALAQFSRVRLVAVRPYVEEAIREIRPSIPPDQVTAHALHELAREREFARRQQVRLRRDMPKALAIADPRERLKRVDAILRRERDYSNAREEAVAGRAAGRADALNVRDLETEGPYWVVGPTNEHTPDCRAMAGHAWPWEVLVEFGMIPPVHTGCACRLITRREAVLEGYERTEPKVIEPERARKLVAAAVALHPHDHGGGPLLEALALTVVAHRA
jgi:hypothetical protein